MPLFFILTATIREDDILPSFIKDHCFLCGQSRTPIPTSFDVNFIFACRGAFYMLPKRKGRFLNRPYGFNCCLEFIGRGGACSSRCRRKKIKIPPGGYFSFGHSPNNTGCAQVRCILACQPCNYSLPPVNWRSKSLPPGGSEAARG